MTVSLLTNVVIPDIGLKTMVEQMVTTSNLSSSQVGYSCFYYVELGNSFSAIFLAQSLTLIIQPPTCKKHQLRLQFATRWCDLRLLGRHLDPSIWTKGSLEEI